MQVSKAHYTYIIIGNGIAGTTAARELRKRTQASILIISDETPYFYSRTALMYVFMGHLRFEDTQPYENSFWADHKIDLLQDRVTALIPEKNRLELNSGKHFQYETLILATGSKPRMLPQLDPKASGIQGFYHKKDLEQMLHWASSTQKAVVVGGGLIGVELAEMLHSRNIEVHFLIREAYFGGTLLPPEEGEMVTEHLRQHGIHLHLNDGLESVALNDSGRVQKVITKKGATLPCDWLGVAIGVTPNIDWLPNKLLNTKKGFLVNDYLQTNLQNIYAIGDCAEIITPAPGRRAIEAVWYSGRKMGETLAKTLSGQPTVYDPGFWFNSAKFFDLEFQTYGQVSPQPNPTLEKHLFWQHPHKNYAIRLAFEPTTTLFLGVLSLGIRLRHRVFDQWFQEKRTLPYVLDHLAKAGFDSEFSPSYFNQMNFKTQWHVLQNI